VRTPHATIVCVCVHIAHSLPLHPIEAEQYRWSSRLQTATAVASLSPLSLSILFHCNCCSLLSLSPSPFSLTSLSSTTVASRATLSVSTLLEVAAVQRPRQVGQDQLLVLPLSLSPHSPLQGSARTGHFRARYRVAKNMRMTKTLRIPPQLACHFWHNNRALLRKMNDFR